MRCTATLICLTLTAAIGCADQDLDLRSELIDYRVLAIHADVPEPAPEDTVTLTVVEHDPADIDPQAATGEPFYVWEICPLSLGVIAQYDCFDPLAAAGGDPMGADLPPEIAARLPAVLAELAALGVSPEQIPTAFSPMLVRSDTPTLSLDIQTVGGVGVRALYSLCAAFSPDGVCVGLDGEPVTLERGWDVYVKLYSGRQGVSRRDSVKLIKVRDFEGRNVFNPALDGLEARDAGGAVVTRGAPEETLTLTLSVVGGSAETYPAIQTDSDGAVRYDADGEPITAEEQEELLYSWYASAGSLDRARGVDDQLDNELVLPDAPGPVRVYAVVRDGRGGFATRSLDLEVVE